MASPAQKAGLEVGDVILQINEQPVVTPDAVREAMSDIPLDRPLRLTVRRDGAPSPADTPGAQNGPILDKFAPGRAILPLV